MRGNKRQQTLGIGFLTGAALIWGMAFVAQRVGMDHIGPFTFLAVRSWIGALFLVVVLAAARLAGYKSRSVEKPWPAQRRSLLGGVICGVLLCAASLLQQVALLDVSAGKAGFLTSLYIVLVPVFGLLMGRKTGAMVWLGVGLAVAGAYLLSMQGGGFTIAMADVLLLVSAGLYAVHIMSVERFAANMDGIVLSLLQFLVCAGIATVLALIFETPTLAGIGKTWLPLLYTGVCSSGIGYTFQILGQQRVKAATASLLMSTESVFAVLGGVVLLNEHLSPRELAGCVLVFAAVVCAQLPAKRRSPAAKAE